MRTIHVAYLNSAKSNIGVARQMQWEKDVSPDGHSVELWSEDNIPGLNVISTYPKKFRSRLQRKYFIMKKIIEYSKGYDVIFLRYSPCDMFSIFSSLLSKNIIYIHHTKESLAIEKKEHRISSKVMQIVEYLSGYLSHRFSLGVVGVTNDILTYEKNRFSLLKRPGYVYVNGIMTEGLNVPEDSRSGKIKALFVASFFHDWHGLDRLLQDTVRSKAKDIEIHIVGKVDPRELSYIKDNNLHNVYLYGSLTSEEIRTLSSEMDCGIGSLSLDRVDLNEACTLKVREYISYGLPVFSGHLDAAFSDNDFYFVAKNHHNLVDSLVLYGKSMRKFEKRAILEGSISSISKLALLDKLLNWTSGITK